MKSSILNRNKIYTIGRQKKTVTVKFICKSKNKTIDSFLVYSVIRRKNKLILYCETGKIWLNFKSLIYAKKYKKIFKNLLKKEE